MFPGITHLHSVSMSCRHGIAPSVAVLEIVPQADFDTETGTLVLAYDGIEIEFPDCKVDRASFARNGQGMIWRLQILDRRWRWRFGQISGRYNERREDGSLRAGENGSL